MIMNLDNTKKIANICVSLITAIVMAVGGGLGVNEYNDRDEEAKVKNSLNILNHYYGHRMLKNKLKVHSAWTESYKELREVAQADPSIEIYEGAVLELVKKKDLSMAINMIFDLFEEVAVCIKLKLCNEALIDLNIRADASSFFGRFYPVICSKRREWNNEEKWKKAVDYYNLELSRKICQWTDLN